MREPLRRCLLVAALLGAPAGCATLLRGPTTMVTVRSDVPGAEVLVDGEVRGATPVVLALEHRASHNILVRHGAVARAYRLESTVGLGWIVLDLVLTSLVGVIVDAVTGAWSSLSQEDVVVSFGDAALLSRAPPAAAPPPVAPWSPPVGP